MGKRKSSKPPPKKKKPKLDSTFNCPFCNSNKSVGADFDYERNIATVSCGICAVTYSTPIDPLTEPVDVYSAWIDACEAENQD